MNARDKQDPDSRHKRKNSSRKSTKRSNKKTRQRPKTDLRLAEEKPMYNWLGGP